MSSKDLKDCCGIISTILILLSLVAIIVTGVIFIDPIVKYDTKYKNGSCRVAEIAWVEQQKCFTTTGDLKYYIPKLTVTFSETSKDAQLNTDVIGLFVDDNQIDVDNVGTVFDNGKESRMIRCSDPDVQIKVIEKLLEIVPGLEVDSSSRIKPGVDWFSCLLKKDGRKVKFARGYLKYDVIIMNKAEPDRSLYIWFLISWLIYLFLSAVHLVLMFVIECVGEFGMLIGGFLSLLGALIIAIAIFISMPALLLLHLFFYALCFPVYRITGIEEMLSFWDSFKRGSLFYLTFKLLSLTFNFFRDFWIGRKGQSVPADEERNDHADSCA